MKLFYCLMLILVSINMQAIKSPKHYFRYVNRAELLVCHKKYDAAAKIYHKALHKEDHPFYRDLNNAILCELLSDGDSDIVKKYFIELVQQGFWLDSTDQYGLSPFLLKSKYSESIVMWNTESRKKLRFHNSADSTMRSLRDADQAMRRYCNNAYGKYTYDSLCLDTIQFVDSINQIKLGVLLGQFELFENNMFSEASLGHIGLMVEHSMQWNKFPNREALYRLVKAGLFDPRKYSRIVDRWSEYTYDKSDTLIGHYGPYGRYLGENLGDYYFIFLDNLSTYSFNKNLINKNREELSMEDFETMHKKIVYRRYYTKLPFLFINSDWVNDNEIGQKLAEFYRDYPDKVLIYKKGETDDINFKRGKR